MATVVELRYYPIKSCAAVAVREAVLTPAGIAGDRAFMVTDLAGGFRNQRRDPTLAVIRPNLDGDELTLRAPGMAEIRVPVNATGPSRPVTLFGEAYRGIDQGDRVAAWLSEILGGPRRLVRVPPDHDRVTDGETPGTSAYADSCAIHLLSTASLDDLAGRLTAPVPTARFRPNVVVDGWPDPYHEDHAKRLTIGAAELGYAKQAIRCVITMVDQDTGGKAGPEPLRTLSRYRRVPEGGVAFGAKFAVLRPGRIAVGDAVT
ncbi:MOSC domain-containing protein [Saccharothrix deserti]|uniref:MOSC domain-containing protein n=1 Tax=Saccharothrix deserti TaxID=2593674 RepID=UPI00131D9D37|nr:MOSC N-terminal beta barrel domain-containing protein [Saccharothrix deserti]